MKKRQGQATLQDLLKQEARFEREAVVLWLLQRQRKAVLDSRLEAAEELKLAVKDLEARQHRE